MKVNQFDRARCVNPLSSLFLNIWNRPYFSKKTEDFSPNISQLRTAKVEQRIPSHTSTHQINTPASLGHITWPKASLRHKTYINNKVMVFSSDVFVQVMHLAKWWFQPSEDCIPGFRLSSPFSSKLLRSFLSQQWGGILINTTNPGSGRFLLHYLLLENSILDTPI